MQKLSESIFNAGIKRNQGEERKIEEYSKFDKSFNLIKNTEFVNIGNHHYISPFNFGSEKVDELGDWMLPYEIRQLNEYLKNTGYKIINFDDWWDMYGDMKEPQRCKLNGYDAYKLNIEGDDLYFLNFGYIGKNKTEPSFDNFIRYGDVYDDYVGFTKIAKGHTHLQFTHGVIDDDIPEKFQVRLMKL